MIITQTPFRMSFFGGGTDMESFFRENGGSVLSTTFDKYCYVNVRHLPRFFDYSTELSYSKTERVTCIEDIQHPAIRNAMKMLDMHEIRLTYEADLPARSGLGTSGFIGCVFFIVEYTVPINSWFQLILCCGICGIIGYLFVLLTLLSRQERKKMLQLIKRKGKNAKNCL